MGKRKQKVSRLQFMLVSGLIVTSALALSHVAELRLNQTALQEVVHELRVVENEHSAALQQIAEYRAQVQELRRVAGALEEVLYNRARTYLFVCGDLAPSGKTAALPSRSAGLTAGPEITGMTMPVCSPSGFTAADFERVWQAHKASRLYGLGETLVKAEEEHGINALVLAAIIVHESRWGRSAIARDKNNLAGLGAFDASPYASAITFASKEDSVYFLAELLAREYIVPEGRYFHGPDLAGIGVKYASDPAWARKVAVTMKVLAQSMVENPEALLSYTSYQAPH